jgi:NhaP-type Na+/H+ or K+/H+ antiporter
VSSPFSAVLAHFILNERLHALGVLGCVMCIAGSVVIVIHAPQEQEITSVREIWNMATQPGKDYYGCDLPIQLLALDCRK